MWLREWRPQAGQKCVVAILYQEINTTKTAKMQKKRSAALSCAEYAKAAITAKIKIPRAIIVRRNQSVFEAASNDRVRAIHHNPMPKQAQAMKYPIIRGHAQSGFIRLTRIRQHLTIYFLPSQGKAIKGCTARIVPNYSAFRKRNRFGASTHETV